MESDVLGNYDIPVPVGASGFTFYVDVVADTQRGRYLSTTFSVPVPAGARIEHDVVLGLQTGGMDCDTVDVAETGFDRVQGVFDENCVGCHSGSDPNAALDLSRGRSYAAIVDVPSAEVPDLKIVEPGASELSFLWEKVNCSVPQVGTRMPIGRVLSASDQAVIRGWIDQGADRSPAGYFVRGDVNSDTWRDVSDVVLILRLLFEGQLASCAKSADVDDSGTVEISDAFVLLSWYFDEVTSVPGPLECGPDPTADDLGCESFGTCDR